MPFDIFKNKSMTDYPMAFFVGSLADIDDLNDTRTSLCFFHPISRLSKFALSNPLSRALLHAIYSTGF